MGSRESAPGKAINERVKELKTTRRSVVRERAVLVEVILKGDADGPAAGLHSPSKDGRLRPGHDVHRDRLEELGRLTEAAGAEVVATITQRRKEPHPGTYVGHGKVEELARLARRHRAHVIIFDNDLSPAQVRNLEAGTETKTIDRSELILDIFASRARTHEARLQVELAQLEYLYPRLRRMWTHLSRMEGGIGTRGPGEMQLETDRRLVRRRIADLARKIRAIDARKKREVRARAGLLRIGIVGYTNAGKSSLLNALTDAHAYVEDKLFATLDTRTRAWPLPYGVTALLSDTVGFLRDLPHHLVASFRATLEEAIHADLLLHIVDVSTEHVRADVAAVEAVLEEIGCADKPQILLLNKVDRVRESVRLDLALLAFPDAVAMSATGGQGLERLARVVTERLLGAEKEVTVRASPRDGRFLAWIDRHANVLARAVENGEIVQRVRMPERLVAEIPRVAEHTFAVTAEP